MPNVGEQVPDFALPNQDGKTVRLSDYRDKKVVIFSFPKAGSLGCTIQACAFRDEFPKVEGANAVILGISSDKPEDLKKWKQAQKLQYDLLSDPNHVVLDAWDAWGNSLLGGIIKMQSARRSYWVIDENGVLIDAQLGVSPKDSVTKALRALKQTARVS